MFVCPWRCKTPTSRCRGDLWSKNVFLILACDDTIKKCGVSFFPRLLKQTVLDQPTLDSGGVRRGRDFESVLAQSSAVACSLGITGLSLNQSCYIVLLGLQTILSETTVKRLLNIGCVSVIPFCNHWNMMYGKFQVQVSKETLTVCNFTNTISTSQSFQKHTQWLINHWVSIER